MLKNCGHSMKWKELAVNRMLLVMIKRRANTFFMIVQRKVLKAAEATTVKRWSQRKEHKPEDNAIDMVAAMGIELLTGEQYRELQKLGDFDTKNSVVAAITKDGAAEFSDIRTCFHPARRHQTADANQGWLPLAVRKAPGCKRKGKQPAERIGRF
jgi:hypothetical protein